MRTPAKPLFQARHFWWLAKRVPAACHRAGLTPSQTQRVMEQLTNELLLTSDLFDRRKFQVAVYAAIREVQNEKE